MPNNKVVHIELVSKDPKKSAEFYSTVFDWETSHMEEMDYYMFQDGSVGGGFTKPEDAMPSGTVLYLNTDDIQKSLEQVVANGGTVVRDKTEIPTVGWYGLFKDLDGNLVGLFTNLE